MAVTLHGRQLQWYMAALRATCLDFGAASFLSKPVTGPSNHSHLQRGARISGQRLHYLS